MEGTRDHTREVLLLVGSGSQAQAVQTGIRRYVDRHLLPWRLSTDISPAHLTDLLRAEEGHLGGHRRPDAVVGFLRGECESALRGCGLPLVTCSSTPVDLPGLVRVPLDDHAIGACAAAHLIERGFRNLACYGAETGILADRFAGFAAACARAGLSCHRFDPTRGTGDRCEHFRDRFADLRQTGITGPMAIFCHQDRSALFVRSMCRTLGLSVPDDVALIGVDNDVPRCELEEPKLSSVVVPWWQVGERIGRALHVLFSGDGLPAIDPVRPMGVAARASTGPAAVADPLIARAMRLLARRPAVAWNAPTLAQAVGLSTRRLQARWRRCGGSFLRHLHAVRLDVAEAMVRDTGLPIATIAERAGYGSRQAFFLAFRKRHGCAPSTWRRGRDCA